jgi:hypothetical protein
MGSSEMNHESFDLSDRQQFSRRNFVRLVSAASAAVFVHVTTEADLAYAQRRIAREIPADAILINANENPLGPAYEAPTRAAS